MVGTGDIKVYQPTTASNKSKDNIRIKQYRLPGHENILMKKRHRIESALLNDVLVFQLFGKKRCTNKKREMILYVDG